VASVEKIVSGVRGNPQNVRYEDLTKGKAKPCQARQVLAAIDKKDAP